MQNTDRSTEIIISYYRIYFNLFLNNIVYVTSVFMDMLIEKHNSIIVGYQYQPFLLNDKNILLVHIFF